MKRYLYRAFGFIIESEFELPELPIAKKGDPNLTIKVDKVPPKILNPLKRGVLFELTPNDFILNFKSIGRFRAQNGTLITVDPHSSINQDVRLFILGTMIGVVSIQRGALPLHGSSFLTEKGAIIVTGKSGSGKSSLAAVMLERGYTILSDDISVIEIKEKGAQLNTGIQTLKLWPDILEYFGFKGSLEKVRSSIEKYRMPTPPSRNMGPYPINKILVLSTKESLGFNCEKITGTEKFGLLRNQVFRSQFFELIGSPLHNFSNLTELANSTDVYKIERPSTPLLLKELAEFIEKQFL